jgi:hypothetical protein|tara:strand:- start:390 stop:806 length:417 start_codon:yes stop_codon:yes gene_type:complete
MINGIKLNTNNISMNQRRLRLKELALGTNSLTTKDKERLQPRHSKCITEVVSMVEIPKNRKSLVPKKPHPQPETEEEKELDFAEVLSELGYDFDEDEGYNDFIGMMSKSELKQMIQGIVLDSLDEEDDLNEIIEKLTR